MITAHMQSRFIALLFAVFSFPVMAVPITEFYTGGYRIYLGVVDLTPQNQFVSRMNNLGLDTGLIDFETLPSGIPTSGNDDFGRFPPSDYPVTYSQGLTTSVRLTSPANGGTADLAIPNDGSTGVSQTHVSPHYAVRPNPQFDGTTPIVVDFGEPVAAAGLWLTGIDNFVSGADARLIWNFLDGSSRTDTFDTAGRVINQFFGIVAFEDIARTISTDEIVGFTFQQLGSNWNNADNIWLGQTSVSSVPEPTTLLLMGLGLVGLGFARRRRLNA